MIDQRKIKSEQLPSSCTVAMHYKFAHGQWQVSLFHLSYLRQLSNCENYVVLVLGEVASYQLYSQQDTASLA